MYVCMKGSAFLQGVIISEQLQNAIESLVSGNRCEKTYYIKGHKHIIRTYTLVAIQISKLNGIIDSISIFQMWRMRPLPESPSFIGYSSLPYLRGTTEKIRKSLNEISVKVAMKPICTIGQNFPRFHISQRSHIYR